ncbi:MAG: cation diffusion facilitator family transporter [Actinobacteria bacterium]|nr:cation diffusion facilitator family transporter [Actinomycetota bacterium]
MHEGSKKAIIAAFFANLGIAVAKFVGSLITGSAGLLAEAGHSLADTGNQALLLFGSKRGRRKADHVHPFGYGPERYFWAFVVALVLFSMGGVFALYEGIRKLGDPHQIDSVYVAYGILIFAILLEGFSLRTAIVEARRVKPADRSWWWYIRNAKAPELPVVLLEDVGAETGLVFALFGLTMAEITGDPRWDAMGSIAIGVLLVAIAIVLAVEMKGLLIGEAPSDEVQADIEAAINGSQGVLGIIHLRAMHLGPDELLVATKVEYDHGMSVPDLAAAIDRTEVAMRAAAPADMTIYIEPDIRRSPSA